MPSECAFVILPCYPVFLNRCVISIPCLRGSGAGRASGSGPRCGRRGAETARRCGGCCSAGGDPSAKRRDIIFDPSAKRRDVKFDPSAKRRDVLYHHRTMVIYHHRDMVVLYHHRTIQYHGMIMRASLQCNDARAMQERYDDDMKTL